MFGETKRGGYLRRQWQGDLPLGQSFWLNLVVVNFVLSVAWALASPRLAGMALVALVILFLAAFLVWLWGAVGTWRSADRYQLKPNAKIWGRLAQAVVVLHTLSWFVQGKDLLDNPVITSEPVARTSTLSDLRESSSTSQPLEEVKNLQSEGAVAEWPSAFEARELEGVSISLPRGWHWMGEADSDTLNTASEAMGEAVGFSSAQGNNHILAAGNAFNDAKVSVATIRLSERSAAPTITQADLRNALAEPQEVIRDEVVRQGQTVADAMRKAPQTVFYEAKNGGLRQNDSLICIWTQFEYDIGKGPTVSDSWVCPASRRSIKLTTSYLKSRANLYAPTIEHIWRSLAVD